MNIRVLLLAVVLAGPIAWGDDPAPATESDAADPAATVVSEEVRKTLVPLFSSIATADVSRVTVELAAESAIAGKIIDRQTSTYQIASIRPDQFTIYYKEATLRTRVYGDSESVTIAMAPDAYVRLPNAISTQDAAISLPVPMGPYPEPILALSLAGVDPAISLFGGMKSVQLVDREKFRGEIPSIHFRGIQNDGVSWDLWISAGESPKPLRLLVDLTAMLSASGQVSIPDDFSYRLRMDFSSWRVSGEVDKSLFQFKPPKEAVRFDSLEEYYQSLAGVASDHPLLGQPAPRFATATLEGKKVDSDDLADKVIVLDFWATWCQPCVAAIPVIEEVVDQYDAEDVVFYAINAGEDVPLIKGFVGEQAWEIDVLVDSSETIADLFKADALPQTVIIGKSGVIESVHIGFTGVDELRKRLKDELDVLSVGGKIASADVTEEPAK